MFQNFIMLLEDTTNTIVGGANAASQTAAQSGGAAVPADAGSLLGGGFGTFGMLLMWIVIIGVFYFFTIRPQRKREKEMQNMQQSLQPGDMVVTSAGMFGKVISVGEDCFVIEFGTNRGVHIPVRKSDILGIKTPNINPSSKEAAANNSVSR